jgi:corrinoid protein of di/trimethylamine methyltransferase
MVMADTNRFLEDCKESVLRGDSAEATRLARSAVEAGRDPLEIIEEGFVPGLSELGARWESGDCFLPELVVGSSAARDAIEILRKKMTAGATKAGQGTVVMGTIEGDIHDIGKTLVSALLVAHGFEVFDIGADVKIETFIEQAEKSNADVIGVSALLTTTMLNQKKLVEALRQRKLADNVMVMIGGAPTSRDWAEEIGAHGYGENAVDAVREAKRLVDLKRG